MNKIGARIGQGRTAEIFEWGDGTVVKLFRSELPRDWVDYEYGIARAVQDAAVNAPFVGELVEVDGRRGIVYERVDGESVLRRFKAKPWQVTSLATQFAESHALMHTRTTTALPLAAERLARNIKRAPHLTEETRAEILRRLDVLPVGETVCHGDYHPDNVILSPRGPVVIDWTNAMRGDPLADVARTSIIFTASPLLDTNPVMRVVTRLLRNLFYTTYLNRYRQLRQFDYAELSKWMLPFAAARLDERISGEEETLLSIIQSSLYSSSPFA
jgi:aminoglycoside phosphotransferase (APT) family kinase protein